MLNSIDLNGELKSDGSSRMCCNTFSQFCCLNYLLAARKEYFVSYLYLLCIFVEVYMFDCTYW